MAGPDAMQLKIGPAPPLKLRLFIPHRANDGTVPGLRSGTARGEIYGSNRRNSPVRFSMTKVSRPHRLLLLHLSNPLKLEQQPEPGGLANASPFFCQVRRCGSQDPMRLPEPGA
jgi:hypothetical protein